MSGPFAVDSNAFVAYRAGDLGVQRFIEGASLLYMPSTVLGELLFGALNSGRARENVKAVDAFNRQCMPIAVDDSVAERYASVRMALKALGRPIPENDIWIAASCMEVGATLLTQDRHFSMIDGLSVQGW